MKVPVWCKMWMLSPTERHGIPVFHWLSVYTYHQIKYFGSSFEAHQCISNCVFQHDISRTLKKKIMNQPQKYN